MSFHRHSHHLTLLDKDFMSHFTSFQICSCIYITANGLIDTTHY